MRIVGRLAAIIGLVSVLAGCATGAAIDLTQVGEYAPGRYLANVVVLPPAMVPDRCAVARAWACTWVEWRRDAAGQRVGEAWQVYRVDLVTPRASVAVAHELCHVAVALQGLARDPCHERR